MDLNIYNNHLFLVGVKEKGRSILDKITNNNLEWFLNRAPKFDERGYWESNKCSLEITDIYNHSIYKHFIDDFHNIDFDINPSNPNCIAVILVYEEDEYENVQKYKKSIKKDNICFVDICINDSNDLTEIKAINVKEKDARSIILDMIILMIPIPGLIAFDYADWESFMEEGYRYGSFITIGDNMKEVVQNTVRRIKIIDNIKIALTIIIVGKPYPSAELNGLANISNNLKLIYSFSDDSFNEYRIRVIYKIKKNNNKFIN